MDVSYAPAMAAATMVKSIVGDDRRVLPVVVRIDGEYGLDGISLAFSAASGEADSKRSSRYHSPRTKRRFSESSGRKGGVFVDIFVVYSVVSVKKLPES